MLSRNTILTTLTIIVIASSAYYFNQLPDDIQSQDAQDILIADDSASADEESTQEQAVLEVPLTEESPASSNEQEQATPHERSITITNGITKKMLGYKKAFMTYTPDFSVEIDGTELPLGKNLAVQTSDNSITITYHYNFLNGYKIGSRTIRVTFAPEVTHTTLTFSWKNDNRVILTDALAYSLISKTE